MQERSILHDAKRAGGAGSVALNERSEELLGRTEERVEFPGWERLSTPLQENRGRAPQGTLRTEMDTFRSQGGVQEIEGGGHLSTLS